MIVIKTTYRPGLFDRILLTFGLMRKAVHEQIVNDYVDSLLESLIAEMEAETAKIEEEENNKRPKEPAQKVKRSYTRRNTGKEKTKE